MRTVPAWVATSCAILPETVSAHAPGSRQACASAARSREIRGRLQDPQRVILAPRPEDITQ